MPRLVSAALAAGLALVLALVLARPGLADTAGAASFKSEYTLSAFGLRIASTEFDTTIGDDRYEITGSLRTRGIARLLSTTDGTLTATGRLTAGQVTPVRFEARYTDGGKAKRTVIDFEGDRVADTVNDPVVRKTDDWIDMPAAQLVGAFDPAAAILVPARSLREVCRRTLRVYDGAMRADLKLGYLRTIPFSAKGYNGDAVTCRARLEPVAGYSPTKKDLIYIRDNGDIEISFAPVGRTGLFAPVRVKLRAQPATVLITATRFEQLAP